MNTLFSAMPFIQWQQHRVINTDVNANWLKFWAYQICVELIVSCLDNTDTLIAGHLPGLNCYDAKKVHHFKTHLKLDEYTYIYAYGDSSGDNDMLALADEAHYKPFR